MTDNYSEHIDGLKSKKLDVLSLVEDESHFKVVMYEHEVTTFAGLEISPSRIISAVASDAGYDRIVEYRFNEWTFPKEGSGPLCVFEKFTFAHMFYLNQYMPASRKGHLMIYKCKFVRSRETSIWTGNKRVVAHKNQLPYGTVLADAVMIVESDRL